MSRADPQTDSTPTSAGGRRYRRQSAGERRAERRERLLEAALDAFGSDGYRATSIEQLCAAAGISTRNFYEEFENRERLLIALHDDVNDRARAAVVETLADVDPADVDRRAHAGVLAYLRVMTADRRYARVALVETVGVSAAAQQARWDSINRFADLIRLEAERMASDGLIPARDFELPVAALVGAILGLVNTWADEPEWDDRIEQVADEAARLILLSLRDGPSG